MNHWVRVGSAKDLNIFAKFFLYRFYTKYEGCLSNIYLEAVVWLYKIVLPVLPPI